MTTALAVTAATSAVQRERRGREEQGSRRGRDAVRAASTRKEPTSAPAASVASSRPKPAADSPIGPGSTAYSGKTENVAVDARLEMPTQSGERAQQPVARQVAHAFGDVGPQAGCGGLALPGGTGRRARTSASAARAYPSADAASAPARAAAASSPPSGGPTNWFAVSSTAYRRLFAHDSRSGATTLGRIDWAAVSCSVSPIPRAKASTYSTHSSSRPPATTSASRPIRSIRATSTRTIVRRRSSRSASAPAGRENSSQGRRPTRVTAANAPGSRVMPSATRGKAIWKIPSARFDSPEAVSSRQKFLLEATTD